MFKLSINFYKIIKENLPKPLHQTIRLSRIKALTKPFRMMYAEFVAKKNDLFYKASFNGSWVYLETALNDKFDRVNRGITLNDTAVPRVWIYKKSELKPAIVAYMKWNSITDFVSGKFCLYNGVIYQSNSTPNVGNIPDVDPQWDATTKPVAYIYRKSNYTGSMNFSVLVPSSVVFDETEMRSLIKYYLPAGYGFSIKVI